MPAATKQTNRFNKLWFGGRKLSSGLALAAASGVSGIAKGARPINYDTLTLASFVVSLAAADDFGSRKLCDLPNTGIIIVGAVIEVAGTVAGFASNVGTAVDLAVGTVATASTTFANAGEKDIIPKIDGTGASTTATVKGQSTTTEKNLFVAPGSSNAIYINVSDPVTSGTGTLTLDGFVTVLWIDLDLAA